MYKCVSKLLWSCSYIWSFKWCYSRFHTFIHNEWTSGHDCSCKHVTTRRGRRRTGIRFVPLIWLSYPSPPLFQGRELVTNSRSKINVQYSGAYWTVTVAVRIYRLWPTLIVIHGREIRISRTRSFPWESVASTVKNESLQSPHCPSAFIPYIPCLDWGALSANLSCVFCINQIRTNEDTFLQDNKNGHPSVFFPYWIKLRP